METGQSLDASRPLVLYICEKETFSSNRKGRNWQLRVTISFHMCTIEHVPTLIHTAHIYVYIHHEQKHRFLQIFKISCNYPHMYNAYLLF